MPFTLEQLWDWVVWFVLHRITRYVASWLLAAGLAWWTLDWAWHAFDKPDRVDGNDGHAAIDFGGQWLMGAMLVNGHGKELYNRNYQRLVLEAGFPYEDEIPDENRSRGEVGSRDAKNLMNWFMGRDDSEGDKLAGSVASPFAAADPFSRAAIVIAGVDEWQRIDPHDKAKEKLTELEKAFRPRVGGPLYPPINAIYYAPLGLLTPRTGYRVNQWMCLLYAVLAGLGVSYMTEGRFWWPLATALIIGYPGFKGAIHLGQNPPLTLLFLIWGWALMIHDRPIAGGIVWGLLAFKPVWALAFFLVPFLTVRWRACLAMILTGGALVLLTLPFVGVHSWLHWLQVGQMAADLYKTDNNWVHLSRDLLGIPRRFLVDFTLPNDQRNPPGAAEWGYALLLGVIVLTVAMPLWRFKQAIRAKTGPIAAFLLLGAWLSCFHFMYYDILLTALPMFVLLAEPRRYFEPIFLAILPLHRDRLGDDLAGYYAPRPPYDHPATVPLLRADYRNLWVVNRMVINVLVLLLFIEHVQQQFPLNLEISGWLMDKQVKGRIFTTQLWHGGWPWDTFVALFLWLWCGMLWVLTPRKPAAPLLPGSPEADVMLLSLADAAAESVESAADVDGSHEGFSDQYRASPRGLQP